MKMYFTPFSKGEVSFTIKGDVSVDELIEYVKEILDGVLEYKEAMYEDKGKLVEEFESSVDDVIYNVTIVDNKVTIKALNIKGEDDPSIILKAQEILNAFKDINSYFKGRRIRIGKFRFHTKAATKHSNDEKVPFEF